MAHDRLELLAAFAVLALPPVVALPFQQVVGKHRHRRFLQYLGGQVLAADALLQQGEGLHAEAIGAGLAGAGGVEQLAGRGLRGMLPDQDLAIDHRAVGQAAGQFAQLGKTLADQLLTARPDPDLPVALDQLGADAIPLPFDEPVVRRAKQRVERVHRGLQRMSEKERVGLATTLGMLMLGFFGDQRAIALGAGPMGQVGVADQALRDALGVEVGQRGQRAGDQQFRHADAKGAGDQLDADHQAEPVQLCPERRQAFGQLLRRQAAQR